MKPNKSEKIRWYELINPLFWMKLYISRQIYLVLRYTHENVTEIFRKRGLL